MADPRPPPSVASHDADSYPDPFADRPLRPRFVEPEIHSAPSPSLRGYDSVASLSQEFVAQGAYDDDDEYVEKQPLTHVGGFYPPA
jgi:hypothetical protein